MSSPWRMLSSIAAVALAFTAAEASSSCCEFLQVALSDKLHSSTSPYYEESRNSYWATQAAAIGPACILAPTTTQDVSTAVKLLSASNCQFAVRSGGHNSWGASTIQGGVVIDLSALNEVTVSADQKSTRVGPGRRWQDVYQKLDTMELAIPGGRLGTVGVGGLILGGGISFFSPRTGFVCDNVLNYEVVLASGEIVDANATSHSTLFKALKGSSNNLGIVTAFTMKTFSQGKFYGGSIILHDTNADQIVSELYKIATTPDYDENAAIIQNLAWGEHEGQPNWIFYGFCTYTGVDKTPTIFEPFTNIHPQYVNSMRVSNLTDFTMELANYSPNGHKNALITTTIVPDEKMMHRIIELCQEAIPAISQQGVIGIRFALTFQPLPLKTTKWGEDLDENVLGLDAKENLLLVSMTYGWHHTNDYSTDNLMPEKIQELIDTIEKEAKKRKLWRAWKYMNYAFEGQDVLTGYGEENLKFINAVSKEYDPDGVFQKLVPGGFKLDFDVGTQSKEFQWKDEL